MKFKEFVDKDIQEFTELKIGLVDKENIEINELVRKVEEKFNLGTDLLEIKNELNEFLGNRYGGKFKFDFCLQEFKEVDKLKINRNKKEIKLKWFQASGNLAETQTEVERQISNN